MANGSHAQGLLIVGSSTSLFGGIETLEIRMLEWCKENGVPFFWLSVENPKDSRLHAALDRLNCPEAFWYPRKGNRSIVDYAKKAPFRFQGIKKLTAISFCLPSFVALEVLKRRYPDIAFSNFFYSVSPYDFVIRNKPLSRCIATHLAALPTATIQKMVDRHMICFMEKEGFEQVQSERKDVDFSSRSLDIMKLPHKVSAYDDEKASQRWEKPDRVIISCARLDFPFKGYMLGLVDAFEKLLPAYSDVKLLLIGDGPGKEKLLEKIAEKPANIREKITLKEKVPYQELRNLLDVAYVNVGMGTTVLDASDCGVPTIVVNPQTYECKSKNGLFCDYWENLGEPGEGKAVIDYLRYVFSLSKEEYMDISRKSYDIYKQNYDINQIMPEWILKKNSKTSFLMSQNEIKKYQRKLKVYRVLQEALHLTKGLT